MKASECVRFSVGLLFSTLIACGGAASGPSGPTALSQRGGGETLFAEDFESGTLDGWQDGVNPSKQRVVTGPDAQGGTHYLAVTYAAGGDGGWLTRFFMPGYQTLYVSLYVRIPSTWMGGTKLVGLYGSRTDNQWSAFGKAGVCPNGTDFFDAMLLAEANGNPGQLRFYTYYPDMAKEPGGDVCFGRYGDKIGEAAYGSQAMLRPDTWHRVEFLVQLNTPRNSDGQQTFWLDGAQGATWQNIKLRDSDILRLNAVQLSFSQSGGAPQTQELYMDSIEVRTARK